MTLPVVLDDVRKRSVPQGIPGLKLWLAADKITGVLDGNPLTTWLDLSGNGHDFTVAVAGNKPTYRTGIVNSLPIVRFDGSNDYLEGPAAENFRSVDEYTLFAVFVARVLDTNNANEYSNDTLIGGDGGNWGIKFRSAPIIYIYNWDGDADVAAKSISVDTAYLFTAWHFGDNIYASLDGDSEASAASDDCSGLVNVVHLGRYQTLYTQVDIAEILMFSGRRSPAERGLVNSYLATKWGITLA